MVEAIKVESAKAKNFFIVSPLLNVVARAAVIPKALHTTKPKSGLVGDPARSHSSTCQSPEGNQVNCITLGKLVHAFSGAHSERSLKVMIGPARLEISMR
jgi:hypothetical protein